MVPRRQRKVEEPPEADPNRPGWNPEGTRYVFSRADPFSHAFTSLELKLPRRLPWPLSRYERLGKAQLVLSGFGERIRLGRKGVSRNSEPVSIYSHTNPALERHQYRAAICGALSTHPSPSRERLMAVFEEFLAKGPERVTSLRVVWKGGRRAKRDGKDY